MRLAYAGGGTVALALLVTLYACGAREEPGRQAAAPEQPPTVAAAVTEVRQVQFPITVEVTGQVSAATQAILSSKIQGTVQQVLVEEGASVSKGQRLIALDSRDLEAQLARAEAERDNAKAHLARMTRLYRQESVAKQELDDATRAYKVAEANRRAAAAQLSYTEIKAPFDGIVTEKKLEVGELAAPGQPALKMEDPKSLRLEAVVSEGDLKAIKAGDQVPVTVDALNHRPLTGMIAQILPAGDPATHTFLVKVSLPLTPGLRTGMFARMQIGKGTSQTLAVAKPALVERGQLTGLYVVGPDRMAQLRWVKVGRSVGDTVEVLSGVDAGEHVLADASKGRDGALVQITETVAAPAP